MSDNLRTVRHGAPMGARSGDAKWLLAAFLGLGAALTLGMAGFAGTFILQGAVTLGIFVGGWFSDRVCAHAPHRRMLLYGGFYLLAAPFLLSFLGRPAFPLLAVGVAAFSFLRGLGQANDNPTQCEVAPRQFRATGLGVMNAVFQRTDPRRLMPRLARSNPKACWVLVLADRRMQQWFETSGLPAVVYGNVYSGLSLPGAGINYHACIRHATSLLLAKGHRRIALVAYDARRAGEQDTVRGFREACDAHRGEPVMPLVVERPDSDANALCRQLDGVLRAAQRPTAFVVSHTHHYATVATHLASRGLRVPDDVSLICRSEDPFLQFMRPRPAFYRANMEVAAKLLFDRVRHVIEGTAKPGDQRLLVPELVTGESVAAPPAPKTA